MSGSAVYWAVRYGYRLWGNAYSPSQPELAHTVWLFYMSKFYEFFDTVWAQMQNMELTVGRMLMRVL